MVVRTVEPTVEATVVAMVEQMADMKVVYLVVPKVE